MRIAANTVVTVVFSTALLAGCSGNNAVQPSPAGGTFLAPNRVSIFPPGVAVLRGTALGTHALPHPNPCCVQTIFVSDFGADEVQLYKFPNGNYVGQLPQPPETFSLPTGECVDATNPQHVFVANENKSTIDEYTHGGVYVMHLADAGEFPVSCAYRQTGPTSGLLAVGNNNVTMGGPGGSISVYADNAGAWSGPTIYAPPGSPFVDFVSYKGSTLFLDAHAAGVVHFMSMSPTGTFTLIPIARPPCTINIAGGVQHIGQYLAVGDESPSPGCPNIDWVLPSGGVIGSTTLSPSPHDLVQFFREGSKLVGPDAGGANADIYSYPNGPLLTNVTATLVAPVGSAISHQ
jgi:hypothetical protein